MRVLPINNLQNFSKRNISKKNDLSTNVGQQSDIRTKVYINPASYSLAFKNLAPAATNFSKEIAEQPKVIKDILHNFFGIANKVTNININLSNKEMKAVKALHIVASGSSKNASEMAKKFMERVTNLPVNIYSASEFMTSSPKINNKDLMIFVSQSGNATDTYEALKFAEKNKIKSIALTNNMHSKISRDANFSINMHAGTEQAVAATKTVTSTVVNLWGIALKLAEIKNVFHNDIVDIVRELNRLPNLIENMIKDDGDIKNIAKKYSDVKNIYILAKEPNVGAANEGALKLTETTQKRVISGSSSEFMHGLFTSMQPDDLYIQIATGNKADKAAKLAKENLFEIKEKRHLNNVVVLKNSFDDLGKDIDTVSVPSALSDFQPLLNTIRLQQLTEAFTKELNINPDNGGGVLTKYRSNLTMSNKH